MLLPDACKPSRVISYHLATVWIHHSLKFRFRFECLNMKLGCTSIKSHTLDVEQISDRNDTHSLKTCLWVNEERMTCVLNFDKWCVKQCLNWPKNVASFQGPNRKDATKNVASKIAVSSWIWANAFPLLTPNLYVNTMYWVSSGSVYLKFVNLQCPFRVMWINSKMFC